MPRLVVVPTPIGNLEDITVRALRVLREVGVILAEDTRHTRRLLRHYAIDTRLLSYHQHNKRQRIDEILRALEQHDVAVVSSAGMPSISDPGFELIEAIIAAGIELDVLPGPSAAPTAVVAAALPAPGFIFAGFLPRRAGERRDRLHELAKLPYTLVFYEAPHRLRAALRDIETVLGDRRLVACRELTKLHQEFVRGTVSELIARYSAEEPRGEFTLVVGGASPSTLDRTDEARSVLTASIEGGADRQSILAMLAAEYGLNRNAAYRLWLEATHST